MERRITCDPRLEEYKPFLDSEFPQALHDSCGENVAFQNLVLDLLLSWRAASYAAAMPYLLVKSMESQHDGYISALEPDDSVLRFSEVILAKLAERIGQVSADHGLQASIRQELFRISNEVLIAKKIAQESTRFPLEEAWQQYLDLGPFQVVMWGLLRTVFISVYNAYEEFVVHAAKLVLQAERLRTTQDDFSKRLVTAFGESVAERAWFSDQVNLFKLVRNSLVHAGGRITADLRGKAISYPFDSEGRLHFHPCHIRELHIALREPVLQICKSSCNSKPLV